MWGVNPQEERVKLFKSISPQRRHSLTNPSQHWCAHEESLNQWALRLILSRHDCRQKAFNIICCDVSHSGGTEDGCEHPVKEAARRVFVDEVPSRGVVCASPSLPVTTQHVPGVESAHNAAPLRPPTKRKPTREPWMHDLSSIQQSLTQK